MFETPIPIPKPQSRAETDPAHAGHFTEIDALMAGEVAELRPIAWDELVAKLSAASDLRRVLTPQVGASFARGAARYLSAPASTPLPLDVSRDARPENASPNGAPPPNASPEMAAGIHAVNPNGLEHGKTTARTKVAVAPIAAAGERETL